MHSHTPVYHQPTPSSPLSQPRVKLCHVIGNHDLFLIEGFWVLAPRCPRDASRSVLTGMLMVKHSYKRKLLIQMLQEIFQATKVKNSNFLK